MFPANQEENLLSLLVWHETYAAEIAFKVPLESYSTPTTQKIAKLAVEYFQKYSKPPQAHIRDLLSDEINRPNNSYLMDILTSIDSLRDNVNVTFVLDKIDEFVRLQKLDQCISDASYAINENDIEGAEKALSAASSAIADTSYGKSVWLHDHEEWFKFLEAQEDSGFSTGIEALDEKNIKPERGTILLMIAPAKKGKSWFLTNIGKTDLVDPRLQHNVLHITLENSLRITSERYTQALLSMTRQDATVHTLKIPLLRWGNNFDVDDLDIDVEALMLENKDKYIDKLKTKLRRRGKLKVQWFPTGSLTVQGLQSYLDKLEKTENFKPDLVLLDYADLMFTDEKNLRISTGRLYRDLRGLAGTRNFALVTATQGNRASNDARIVKQTHVAEDWSKIGTVDTVITYTQTDFEKVKGLANIFVAAARNSEDGWTALISQSYAIGQFCLDSIYKTREVGAVVARINGENEDND